MKSVVNDNGGTAAAGAWTLGATGTSGSFSGTANTAAVTSKTVTAGVQYTLAESGGPSTYSASSWVCTGGGSFAGPDKITLGLGEDVTCTITNNDQGPSSDAREAGRQRQRRLGRRVELHAHGERADLDLRPGRCLERRVVLGRDVCTVRDDGVRLHGRELVVHRHRHAERRLDHAGTRPVGHLHDHEQRPAGDADRQEGRRQRQRWHEAGTELHVPGERWLGSGLPGGWSERPHRRRGHVQRGRARGRRVRHDLRQLLGRRHRARRNGDVHRHEQRQPGDADRQEGRRERRRWHEGRGRLLVPGERRLGDRVRGRRSERSVGRRGHLQRRRAGRRRVHDELLRSARTS